MSKKQKITTVKIGGEAGQGIKSAGQMLAKVATRSGYQVYTYIEYPSLIRGGHNVMQISISEEEVLGPSTKTDLLVALNQETADKHAKSSKWILADEGVLLPQKNPSSPSFFMQIPMGDLAEEAGKRDLLQNTVALGAVVCLLGGDLQIFKNLLSEQFGDKGEKVVEMNYKAAVSGYDYAKKNFADEIPDVLKPIDSIASAVPTMLLNGNEAAALGAIAGGVQFSAIYPMSPISNILHVLAKHQEEYGYVYKQPEDEIAAINMIIGAAHAGVRSLTATSGGGFALMSEGYGLAGMAEIPVVIVEGMRGGPATGIPTWSEQGDLKFVLSAHQSDFPRIVLTPGDPKEVFEMTMLALNLAEKYQTPVVVLVDKNVCENDQSFMMFDISSYKMDRGKFTMEKVKGYKRYKLEDDGVSLRTIPGAGNFFIANSDEHTEIGYDEEGIKNRNAQMEKRMKKLETCAKEDMPKPQLFGPKEADLTIVSWGSNKGSILQAMKNHKNVNYLHLTWANPFPADEVAKVLSKAKYIVNVECNFTAQMGGLIAEKAGIRIEDNLLKYNGRPFYVEEIEAKIKEVL